MLRKIADPPHYCTDPEHNPPTMIVLEPGTWEHVCPGCGARTVLIVPLVTLGGPVWRYGGQYTPTYWWQDQTVCMN